MPEKDLAPRNTPWVLYDPEEDFTNLPMSESMTLAFITGGNASFILNEKAVSLTAPCLLMLTQFDSLKLVERLRLQAASFSFTPSFLNAGFNMERLVTGDFPTLQDKHDRNIVNVFIDRDEHYYGVIDLPPQVYLRISEWFTIMGGEVIAPSDYFWTCRIRRYLLQTLYLLEDIYMARETPNTVRRDKSPADIVLEYMHTNYANDINLEDLCQLIHLNRTSLNRQFKTRTGRAPMEYLLSHRLKIACETLIHTALNLNEISESLGFRYETYFIRQFTAKMGMSPTEYRKTHGLGIGYSI